MICNYTQRYELISQRVGEEQPDTNEHMHDSMYIVQKQARLSCGIRQSS